MEIIDKFKPLFQRDVNRYPYVVLAGGRNSTKSWTAAYYALSKAIQSKKRILCCREFQNSISESTHSLLCETIERIGASHLFTITNTTITCNLNGSEFIFAGLRKNINNIKSKEAIDMCIVEEAATVSQDSWDKLIPTIRSDGSEIIIIFNPEREIDPTWQTWIKKPLPGTLLIESSYKDNPWLSAKSLKEIEHLKLTDYNSYLHIYGGEPTSIAEDSIFNPIWFDACIDAHTVLGFKPEGVKVIGFDPAGSGADTKAYTIRQGSIILDINHWNDGDLVDAVDKTFVAILEHNISHLVYDGVGIGEGVYGLFEPKLKSHEYELDIRVFKGGNAVDNPNDYFDGKTTNENTFKNLKAQYIWELRKRMMLTYRAVVLKEYIDPNKMISFSSECKFLDELKYELCSIKRTKNNDIIQIESKKDSKGAGFKSPGLFDSLYMSLANNYKKAIKQKKLHKKQGPITSIC